MNQTCPLSNLYCLFLVINPFINPQITSWLARTSFAALIAKLVLKAFILLGSEGLVKKVVAVVMVVEVKGVVEDQAS